MKTKQSRRISLFMILILTVVVIPWSTAKAESKFPDVNAHAYVVMDANSGEVLYSENETKTIYPASTTKLMTSVVALENAPLNKKIKTKQSVLDQLPSDADVLGLKANVTYKLNQLLQMTLIVSAADAANTIAADIGGTTKKFVKKMNQKAEELGMNNTSFDNAVGLDIGNGYNNTYTTASDFSVLARYAMSKKAIRDIVAMKTYQVPKSISKTSELLKNTNLFYSTQTYSSDRYNIIGTKTGTTKAAGSVLIATARDAENHEVICAFFGNINRANTYQDVRELLDYTFQEYDSGNIMLSKGFYDVRFRDSEQTILKYCNEDLLTGDENGAFLPTAKITQQDFVNTVNAICGCTLVPVSVTKNITLLDLADMLMAAYPVEVTDESIAAIKDSFQSKKPLTEEQVKTLTALYERGILPKDYGYNANAYITKEEMVLIADKLSNYINTLPKTE